MKSFAKKHKAQPKKRAPFYSVLGGLLRMRRTQLGLSQKALAKKLKHADPAGVNGYETGRIAPPVKHLAKLAAVLSVNLHQLEEAFSLDQHRRKFAAEIRALNKRQGLA